MKPTALITGASRGIGAELARTFASKNTGLILVARSEQELNGLKQELERKFEIPIKVIAKDLTKSENVQAVYDEIKAAGIQVDYLINNAGFGDFAYFTDTAWSRHEQMIDLNVSALSHFCHLFVQDWVKRKSGKILNVASTAAFQPGPKMSVYFASKAYVVSFSQALEFELRKYGITVTTFCPGPTESNFREAARMARPNGLLKNKKPVTSKEVAEAGYRAMMKGKSVVIHGALNRFVATAVRFMPRKMLLNLAARVVSW
ncbi:MAG: SDR family oxidoreductase [Bacteroidia bacterium]|nr:SDR family oxidoreductase [Bacteroidia bacterium]